MTLQKTYESRTLRRRFIGHIAHEFTANDFTEKTLHSYWPAFETYEPEVASGFFDVFEHHATLESDILDRLTGIEQKIEELHQMVIMMSQSYYWTDEWQSKEKRADEDARLGRSKSFESSADLFKDLER